MAYKNQITSGIYLLLLGIAIAACSIWLYSRLAAAEAQGLHFRFHWFFYAIYKVAGKTVVCIILGALGLGIAALGVRKMFIR
jgi:hypothetical protein